MNGSAAAGYHPAGFDALMSLPLAGLRLGIRIENAALAEFEFLLPGTVSYRQEKPEAVGLAWRIVVQLQCYLRDLSFQFELPLAPRGSPFQQRVWAELRNIPPGKVCRYGDIARRLGTSARAVGSACRANPLPIVVPCHRVVASGGLGGYSGATAGTLHRIKPWLLAHEGYRNGSCNGDHAASSG